MSFSTPRQDWESIPGPQWPLQMQASVRVIRPHRTDMVQISTGKTLWDKIHHTLQSYPSLKMCITLIAVIEFVSLSVYIFQTIRIDMYITFSLIRT